MVRAARPEAAEQAADELLPKGKAKQLYLLNDADIAHLGSIKRENPHKAAWNSMRLYLLSQVEAVAAAKHGGLDELEDRRRSLSLCASERRIAKKRDGEALAQAKEKRIQRLQDKLCAEVEADLSQGAMDSQGGSSGAIMRTYQNGMQVELEEI
eukprot:jgi/Tetstr1/427545/TSEL_017671.t1